MTIDKRAVVELIREFVAQHAGKSLSEVPEFSHEHDLFENGDLDSFGFVELLSLLGDRTGRFVDLSDIDPAELATVGTLAEQFSERGEP